MNRFQSFFLIKYIYFFEKWEPIRWNEGADTSPETDSVPLPFTFIYIFLFLFFITVYYDTKIAYRFMIWACALASTTSCIYVLVNSNCIYIFRVRSPPPSAPRRLHPPRRATASVRPKSHRVLSYARHFFWQSACLTASSGHRIQMRHVHVDDTIIYNYYRTIPRCVYETGVRGSGRSFKRRVGGWSSIYDFKKFSKNIFKKFKIQDIRSV